MDMLTGEFNATLDEKSRISLPAPLRKVLSEENLFLTKGTGKCLWLYPPAKWIEMKDTIMENTNPFSRNDLNLRRKILGPCQPVEIDKAGRIPISPTLREFASMTKECVVLGQIDYIEIWAVNCYKEYLEASDEEFDAATAELSYALKNKGSAGR